MDDNGATLARDGVSQGELMVRGQWILTGYYKGATSPLVDGWFPTGDIATIDAQGVMQIRDRAKDVIKTGGEWVSSIDIENAAMMHPGVASAAVIGVAHPKWQERPLLIIVPREGASPDGNDIREFVKAKLDKIAWPDAVEFVKELPLGATGKVLKTELRKKFKGYQLPA